MLKEQLLYARPRVPFPEGEKKRDKPAYRRPTAGKVVVQMPEKAAPRKSTELFSGRKSYTKRDYSRSKMVWLRILNGPAPTASDLSKLTGLTGDSISSVISKLRARNPDYMIFVYKQKYYAIRTLSEEQLFSYIYTVLGDLLKQRVLIKKKDDDKST